MGKNFLFPKSLFPIGWNFRTFWKSDSGSRLGQSRAGEVRGRFHPATSRVSLYDGIGTVATYGAYGIGWKAFAGGLVSILYFDLFYLSGQALRFLNPSTFKRLPFSIQLRNRLPENCDRIIFLSIEVCVSEGKRRFPLERLRS